MERQKTIALAVLLVGMCIYSVKAEQITALSEEMKKASAVEPDSLAMEAIPFRPPPIDSVVVQPASIQFWANAGLGLGSNLTAAGASLNLRNESRLYTLFVAGSQYDTREYIEIGALYGISGGSERFMYSVAGGLSYVENSQVIFTSESPGWRSDETMTIGIPVQAHISSNYMFVGVGLGLHASLSSRPYLALMLELNLGKLSKQGTSLFHKMG